MADKEESMRLVVKCHDSEEYGDLYGLNKQIPEEEIRKAEPYMKKFTPKTFKNIMSITGNPHGWMCTYDDVAKVEEALGITDTLAKRQEDQNKKREEYNKTRVYKEQAQQKIEETFRDAPRPKQKLSTLLRVAREVYDPANSYRDNSYYGGGHLFIITKKSIWYIMNNGRKENNWKLNNIEINDAPGAIGFRVDYSNQLHELIKTLTENNIYSGEVYIEGQE
ncbi:MAG: hypothetical protein LUG89_02470 [Methanosphaera sp.]|nr:hypothetical protein [Methanosphaera sp.]